MHGSNVTDESAGEANGAETEVTQIEDAISALLSVRYRRGVAGIPKT